VGCWAIAPVSSVAQIFEPCVVVARPIKLGVFKDTKVSSPASYYPTFLSISCIFFDIASSLPAISNPKQATSSDRDDNLGKTYGIFRIRWFPNVLPLFREFAALSNGQAPLSFSFYQISSTRWEVKYSSLACSLFSSHFFRFSLEHKLSWPCKSSKI
jgi:hypothetical protein